MTSIKRSSLGTTNFYWNRMESLQESFTVFLNVIKISLSIRNAQNCLNIAQFGSVTSLKIFSMVLYFLELNKVVFLIEKIKIVFLAQPLLVVLQQFYTYIAPLLQKYCNSKFGFFELWVSFDLVFTPLPFRQCIVIQPQGSSCVVFYVCKMATDHLRKVSQVQLRPNLYT